MRPCLLFFLLSCFALPLNAADAKIRKQKYDASKPLNRIPRHDKYQLRYIEKFDEIRKKATEKREAEAKALKEGKLTAKTAEKLALPAPAKEGIGSVGGIGQVGGLGKVGGSEPPAP